MRARETVEKEGEEEEKRSGGEVIIDIYTEISGYSDYCNRGVRGCSNGYLQQRDRLLHFLRSRQRC